MTEELFIDLFAGAGGASVGIEQAIQRPIDLAANHSRRAVIAHKANHPSTVHLCEDLWKVDPEQAVKGVLHRSGQLELFDQAEDALSRLQAGYPVGGLWASPDCTHFSKAKGGKPLKKKIRGLAHVVIQWAKAVRPRVIFLENVEEFRTWGPLLKNGRPDPARKGQTYKRWKAKLRRLGYVVEDKELRACDFGAPTSRKRLFLVARCDGQPIVWPKPTHGPKCEEPHRGVWECLDWSDLGKSIFGRKKDLAENTLKRVGKGLKKFVIDNPDPFIISYYGPKSGEGDFRGCAITDPLPTQTTENRFALVSPVVVVIDNKNSRGDSVWPPEDPLRTITKENRFAVASFVTKFRGDSPGTSVETPLPTITSGGKSKRPAGAAHALGLASAFIMTNTTGNGPESVKKPLKTITTGNQQYVAVAFGSKFYGTSTGFDMRDPLPTITSNGQHLAQVVAFLTKYYSSDIGQDPRKPLHTITSKGRFAVVSSPLGEDVHLADIKLRMLKPRELLLAQGFPPDYVLHGSNSDQIAMIGNSVPPHFARAVVQANYCAPKRAESAA